jgi:hypothetical protein
LISLKRTAFEGSKQTEIAHGLSLSATNKIEFIDDSQSLIDQTAKLELLSSNQKKKKDTNHSKRERGHLWPIPGQPEVGWFDAVGLAIAARNGEDFIGE